jgi:hypothetical protein
LAGLTVAAEKTVLMFDGLAGNIGWLLNTRRGYGDHLVTYMGNPSAASGELGKALRTLIAQDLLAEVDAVIEGRTLPSDVHSLFWQVPFFRTTFFRKLGLTAAVVLIIILLLVFL